MQLSPLAFDYQSTTPCEKEVIEAMEPYWNDFWGNPSSRQNRLGTYAAAAIKLSREKLAGCLKVQPEAVVFTSGATESNNLALLGFARANALTTGRPGHIITLRTEHHSVLDPLRQLQKEGFDLTELQPQSNGLLLIDNLNKAFRDDTILVSIMLANNEIGVIQPLHLISSLCRERGVVLHSDAAQAFGNLSLEVSCLGIDLLSLSAHKIYGPKGVGALVINNKIPLLPLTWGGGQELGLRPGTLPVPLVVGMAHAAEIATKNLQVNQKALKALRDQLWQGLSSTIEGLKLNGCLEKRLPNNLNITVEGIKGSRLHRILRTKICCSSGSACSNGSPSHVLQAIGLSTKEAESTLRLSIGRSTTCDDINKAIYEISKAIKRLRL